MTPLTDQPIYAKHPVRPSTDESLIAEFKRTHNWFICHPRKMEMTEDSCRALRKKALVAQRLVYQHHCRNTVVADAFISLEKCAECREYVR